MSGSVDVGMVVGATVHAGDEAGEFIAASVGVAPIFHGVRVGSGLRSLSQPDVEKNNISIAPMNPHRYHPRIRFWLGII